MPRQPSVLPSRKKATATVIWIHGYNDQGDGWAELAEDLAGLVPHARWVFPHANQRKITLHDGELHPAWFDILARGPGAPQDRDGMLESVKESWFQHLHISQFLTSVNPSNHPGPRPRPTILPTPGNKQTVNSLILSQKTPSDRIVLGGFSQGCAISLLTTLLSTPSPSGGIGKLAGVFGIGGVAPLRSEWSSLVSPANPNRDTPIRFFHGKADTLIPAERAHESLSALGERGFTDLGIKEYEGVGHTVNFAELQDIGRFIASCVPPL